MRGGGGGGGVQAEVGAERRRGGEAPSRAPNVRASSPPWLSLGRGAHGSRRQAERKSEARTELCDA